MLSPASEPQSDAYREGIVEAEGAGQISYWKEGKRVDKPAYGDAYDPSKGLRERNRSLTPEAKEALMLLSTLPVCRVLMIGPGAGNECVQAHAVAPDRIVIDTCTKSPFNPAVRLTDEHHPVKDRIGALLADLRNAPEREMLRQRHRILQVLLAPLDARSPIAVVPFVEPCMPYVRHQFVGWFGIDVPLPEHTYALVYDSHAAYLHGSPTLQDGMRLLSDEGVMMFDTWKTSHAQEIAAIYAEAPVASLVPVVLRQKGGKGGGGHCLIAAPDSAIACAIRTRLGSQRVIHEVDDIAHELRSIAPDVSRLLRQRLTGLEFALRRPKA